MSKVCSHPGSGRWAVAVLVAAVFLGGGPRWGRVVAQEVPGGGGIELEEARKQASEVANRIETQGKAVLEASKRARPLELSVLPRSITALFHDFNPGLAGLLLLASSLMRGWKVSAFVIPAVLIALFGERMGVPEIGPLTARQASAALAVGVSVVGFVFGRAR